MKKVIYLFLASMFMSFSAVAENSSAVIAAEEMITTGNEAALKDLLAKGLEVNLRDEDGNTLLLYALLQDTDLSIAKILIANGADVNAPSSETGITPLIVATSRAHNLQKILQDKVRDNTDELESNLQKKVAEEMNRAKKLLRLLIKNGADVNQETPYGTPLMNAAANAWNIDIVNLLIENNADINQRNRKGQTALFYAEALQNNDIEALLIAAGANVDIKDNYGHTYIEVNKKDVTLY